MEEHTKHYLISGRVQGVGFRRFAERVAREMNLRGWVRNLHDGRVEALAQGPAAALVQFESRLRAGPAHGCVDNVNIVSIEPPEEGLEKFTTRKDGTEPWPEN